MRPAAFLLLLLGAVPARAGDPLIAQAIEQLMRDDQDSGLAERVLQGLPKQTVVEEAARELLNGVPTIRAKRRLLLFLLSRLGEGDLVARTLECSSISAKRAAAAVLAGLPAHADATKAILLAWIAQELEPTPDAPLLVEACRKAKLNEAGPWLRKVLEAPDTPPQAFADALAVLVESPSADLAEIVKKRLADPKENPTRIAACIDALKKFPNMPADELLLPWLKQRDARILRLKAVFALRDAAAHRAFLLDQNETDSVLQRNCLYRLMEALDDAALLELLRDPRVNRHRYFAIRVDVCTALAAVEGSGKQDVPILLDYLLDEDPLDRGRLVRGEAWLTLWILTGEMHGIQGDFAKPPGRGGRACRATRMRPGVTREQTDAVYGLVKDLDHMGTVRAAYAPAK